LDIPRSASQLDVIDTSFKAMPPHANWFSWIVQSLFCDIPIHDLPGCGVWTDPCCHERIRNEGGPDGEQYANYDSKQKIHDGTSR
jgi:hypothetical protein